MSTKPNTTTTPTPETTGPLALEPSWAACCSLLEQVEPMAKAVASFQLSTISFNAQRARARLDTMSRLSECRNPRDLYELHIEFWQKANADYARFAEQTTGLWRDALTLGAKASLAPASAVVEARNGLAPRDMLPLMPAPRERTAETATDGDGRRAA